jgi:hypothetical protein
MSRTRRGGRRIKLSLVKSANVECIRPNELKVGDKILWSNHIGTVLTLNGAYDNFATISIFPEDPDNQTDVRRFSYFYRIKSMETYLWD